MRMTAAVAFASEVLEQWAPWVSIDMSDIFTFFFLKEIYPETFVSNVFLKCPRVNLQRLFR
jgi:hypothetical protein